MRTNILIFIFCFFLMRCTDVLEQKFLLISKNVYATHFAGIDGFSISKKINKSGYFELVKPCIAAYTLDEVSNALYIKKIENLTSTDTSYLKLDLNSFNIDTLYFDKFYNLSKKHKEIVLLKKDYTSQ